MGRKRNMQLHKLKKAKEKIPQKRSRKGVDGEGISIEVRNIREAAGVDTEMISIGSQEIQGQQNANVEEDNRPWRERKKTEPATGRKRSYGEW